MLKNYCGDIIQVMKKREIISYLIIVAVFLQFLLLPYSLKAMGPFGGPITMIHYETNCFEGQRIEIGTPGPRGIYVSTYSTKAYANGKYSRVGQLLLGMSAGYLTCTYYCGTSICEAQGGPAILFYGSS